MTQFIIDVGAAPNDGLGDPIRTAFIKTNDNFTQLFLRATTVPSSAIGQPGDEYGMYAMDSTQFYFCWRAYDGVSVIWATQSASQITSGNSSIVFTSPNGPVAISVSGTLTQTIATTGTSILGGVTASGNVSAGQNALVGGTLGVVGNVSTLATVSAAQLNSNLLYSASSNIVIDPSGDGMPVTGNVNILGNLTVSGNLTYVDVTSATTNDLHWVAANNAPNAAAATGGGLLVGPATAPYASWTFNQPANAWQANIAIIAPSLTGNIAWSNVVGANAGIEAYLPVSNTITAINSNVANTNANVSALANSTANAVANINSNVANTDSNVVALGNVVANVISGANANTVSFLASGNTFDANISGNITANYYFGDGGFLSNVINSNVVGAYSNANAAAFMANMGGNNISTTGTITAVDVYGDVWADNLYTNGAQDIVVHANLVPSANLTYSLGNATTHWTDIWLSNNTIFMGSIPVSLNSNNDLTVNGDPVVTTNPGGTTDINSILSNTVTVGNITANNTTIGDGLTTIGTFTWTIANTATTSLTTLYTANVANVTSIDFTITATSGNNCQVSKLLVASIADTIVYNEYGTLTIGSTLGDFSASADGSNVILQVLPATANVIDYKLTMSTQA